MIWSGDEHVQEGADAVSAATKRHGPEPDHGRPNGDADSAPGPATA